MKGKHVILAVAAIALPVAVYYLLLPQHIDEWKTLVPKDPPPMERSGAWWTRDPFTFYTDRGRKFRGDIIRGNVIYFPQLDKKNDPRKFMLFEDGCTLEIDRAAGPAAFYHDGVREAVPTWRVSSKDGIAIIRAVLEACIKIQKAKEKNIESNR